MFEIFRKDAVRAATAQEQRVAPESPLRSMTFQPVPSQRGQTVSGIHHSWDFLLYTPYSTTIKTSPAVTVASGRVRTSATVPALGDFISFCIFIASTTTTP